MVKTVLDKAASVQYWDGNAKWHKLWVEHNNYHDEIIRTLTSFVKPGWRVLDIGAGNGILSLPLSAIGCKVTALEPSCGMRELFYEQAHRRGIKGLSIDEQRWEDVPLERCRGYDLIIACNSLHLTRTGFSAALEKVFAAKPKNMFIISECCLPEILGKRTYRDFTMVFAECFETESSHAYHSLKDVFEHFASKYERLPDYAERPAIMSELIYEKGHIWQKGSAAVSMYWWTKNKISEIRNSDIKFHTELATTDVYTSNQTNRALA
jgi:SAM-dependent methyltransferase